MIFTLFILALASITGATGFEQHSAYGVNGTVPLVEDIVNYIRTPDRQSIVQRTPAGSVFPISDHLGSTRLLLQLDGSIVGYEYGPFGAGDGIRYAEHPYDPHRQLYQTPSCAYDPPSGRFLSVDPQREGANPYSYAENDSINYVDLTGDAQVVPMVLRSGLHPTSGTGYDTGFIGQMLGMHPQQRISDARLVFGESASELYARQGNPAHLRRIWAGDPYSARKRDYVFNDKIYWLVGDETNVSAEVPGLIRKRMASFREISEGTFARDIVLIDVSRKGNAYTKVGRELTAAGLRYSVVRSKNVYKDVRGKPNIRSMEVDGRKYDMSSLGHRRDFGSLVENQSMMTLGDATPNRDWRSTAIRMSVIQHAPPITPSNTGTSTPSGAEPITPSVTETTGENFVPPPAPGLTTLEPHGGE